MPKLSIDKSLWNIWTKTIAVLSGIGMIVGAVMFTLNEIDTKYARANEVEETKVLIADSLKQVNRNIHKTNIRIDYHTLQDRSNYIKREMQQIRVDCKTSVPYQMPADARKRYNDYQIQLDQIDAQMKSMSGKY